MVFHTVRVERTVQTRSSPMSGLGSRRQAITTARQLKFSTKNVNSISPTNLTHISKWNLEDVIDLFGDERVANASTWDLLGQETDVGRIIKLWPSDALPKKYQGVLRRHRIER